MNDNYTEINVADHERDEASVLHFYRKMLAFRKEHAAALVSGTFKIHDAANEETFVYTKHAAGQDLIVVLNMSAKTQAVDIPYIGGQRSLLITSAGGEPDKQMLEPYEGRIYKIVGGTRVEEKDKLDTVHASAGPAFA